MAMKKKMKGNITSPALPGKSILAEVNNNEAGNIYNSLFAKNRKVEYDNKYIALVNIRTNPDNQIFRVMDDDEDIRILAEDIKRNGLMHNLVVFPEQREEGMVYVLLSGERRFRALNYLQEKGDATWNIVNCNVVITPLSKNERKVLLYSANLQVRGGFSDEAIRRQAIAEFITCLQKEPYNMSREEALGATKSVSTVNPRTIERDARIEEKLQGKLKELLNDKLLTRSECETYLRFEEDIQDEIAERVSKSRTAVTNAMRLLKLDDRVQDMLVQDMISPGHARTLLGIDDKEQQYNLAMRIFDEKLSVRDTEKIVKDLQKPKKEEKKKEVDTQMKVIYQQLEERIKSIVGTKVSIQHKNKNKGKIEIEYYSQEELERLIDLFESIK